MSYTMCPACGQHALKVANRCPRCGLPFEQQFFSRAQPPRARSRIPVVLLLGTLLVLMLGTAEWINRKKAESAGKAARSTVGDSVAAMPPSSLVTHAVTIPAVENVTPQQSVEPPNKAAPAPAPPPSAAPQPASQVADPEGNESFAATDWVNVRARPSSASTIVGVLRPGESVQVDSTTQGWYRVRAGRLPGGYVDRRLLESHGP